MILSHWLSKPLPVRRINPGAKNDLKASGFYHNTGRILEKANFSLTVAILRKTG